MARAIASLAAMSTRPPVIERWHAVIAERRLADLDTLLADDVVFLSPAVHTPQEGKEITTRYLVAAAHVLGGADFRYVGEWYGDRSAILEFETKLGPIYVNGVDMITWNDAGRIIRFKVMVRPLKALQTVIPMMGERLQADLAAS